MHGQYNVRANIDHLYVTREEGGRGMMQRGSLNSRSCETVETKEHPLIHHHTNSALLLTANNYKIHFQSETKQIKK